MPSSTLSDTKSMGRFTAESLTAWLRLDSGLSKAAACIILLCIQFVWLYLFSAPKTAQLNMVPGIVFVPLVVMFATYAWAHWQARYLFLALFLVLSLRLPVTVHENLLVMNWTVFLTFTGLLLHWLWRALVAQKVGKILWVCVAVVLFNGASHMGLDSPFTHTFHLANDIESNFQGVDNNQTWECAYEVNFFAVHCDARHFIAAERIFVEPNYDASFSVVLPRYFDGYLKSFVGIEGSRWLSSMAMHTVFWLLSCAAIFRLCLLVNLPLNVAKAAALGTASGWGFVSMFAQPAPYFISYAFGAISLWAVAELIIKRGESWCKECMLVLILVCSTLTYEAYPLMVASWVLLALFGRWRIALLVAVSQIAGSLLWKYIGLAMILGTMGDLNSASSGVSNIAKDFHTWLDVFVTVNVSEFIRLSWVGVQAYAFGNLIYGALAAVVITGLFYKRLTDAEPQRLFWYSVAILNVLVLGATLFIVPQMFHWSPGTGMQPRIAFFSFPLNVVALCLCVFYITPRAVYAVPVVMLLLANIDITGFASQSMMFDYGRLGLFWFR